MGQSEAIDCVRTLTKINHQNNGLGQLFIVRTDASCLVLTAGQTLRVFPDIVHLVETGQRAAFASATVKAVMLMMRRTVADGVRMCTGWAAPSSTGPIAMPPPAAVFSRL